MDLKTLQKLYKAIESRVKLEIEFSKLPAETDAHARAAIYMKLSKARRKVGDILDDEHLAGLRAEKVDAETSSGDLG